MYSDRDQRATSRNDRSAPSDPVTDVEAAGSSRLDFEEEPRALSETMPAWKMVLVAAGVLMSMFLVALDRTIVSTAIPQITNDFHSLDDYGWYGSAYLLSCCALQLLFGKLFTLFSTKHTLFLSVLLFEVASAICGAAPNSVCFIIGRAIAGVGAAGIFAGAMTSMVHIVPLHHKPKLFAAMGSMQAVAQIGGPLIGGAFTTHVTWRWCFYINLPIGGMAMATILLFLDIPPHRPQADKPFQWKMAQLDIPGTILVASGAICTLLALQWGGQTYAWSDGRTIALLAVGGLCLAGFVALQLSFPQRATVPPRLFRNRSVAAAFFLFVFFNGSNFVLIYFIPNWFQAITHVSAAESGIRTIPLVASSVVGLIAGGVATTQLGYYVPCAVVGACLSSVGAGLISSWKPDSSEAAWVGYQILNGIGTGLVYQVPNLAIQTVLPKRDAPTGFAVALFGGLLFSSVFLSVGENVLANELVHKLSKLTNSTVDANDVYTSGATTLLDQLPEHLRPTGLRAYNASLQVVFQIGLALSCMCVPAACALEWKSVVAPWNRKSEGDDAEKGVGSASNGVSAEPSLRKR
ncbi:hypothetical protein VTK73DRAFT_9376 [Phialemonium thermophilum]|uniref:Major facilitator superfamily (MFS) profile domain-containing protein n=1 Tax=Phialemonium thermophilum TaxID=223376 RepID=A0ABR3W2Q0_9PEZI